MQLLKFLIAASVVLNGCAAKHQSEFDLFMDDVNRERFDDAKNTIDSIKDTYVEVEPNADCCTRLPKSYLEEYLVAVQSGLQLSSCNQPDNQASSSSISSYIDCLDRDKSQRLNKLDRVHEPFDTSKVRARVSFTFDEQIKRWTQIAIIKRRTEQVAADQQVKDQNEYLNSEVGFATRMCQYESMIKAFQEEISSEKEIAKVGGYEHKNAIYEASQNIMMLNRNIQTSKAEFKTKFNKEFNAKDCVKYLSH